MGKKSGSESEIRDEQPGSCFLEHRNNFWVKILQFFDADPESEMETIRIRDGKSRIRDKHPGSATLIIIVIKITTFIFQRQTVGEMMNKLPHIPVPSRQHTHCNKQIYMYCTYTGGESHSDD